MNKNKFVKYLISLFAVMLLLVSCSEKPTNPQDDNTQKPGTEKPTSPGNGDTAGDSDGGNTGEDGDPSTDDKIPITKASIEAAFTEAWNGSGTATTKGLVVKKPSTILEISKEKATYSSFVDLDNTTLVISVTDEKTLVGPNAGSVYDLSDSINTIIAVNGSLREAFAKIGIKINTFSAKATSSKHYQLHGAKVDNIEIEIANTHELDSTDFKGIESLKVLRIWVYGNVNCRWIGATASIR